MIEIGLPGVLYLFTEDEEKRRLDAEKLRQLTVETEQLLCEFREIDDQEISRLIAQSQIVSEDWQRSENYERLREEENRQAEPELIPKRLTTDRIQDKTFRKLGSPFVDIVQERLTIQKNNLPPLLRRIEKRRTVLAKGCQVTEDDIAEGSGQAETRAADDEERLCQQICLSNCQCRKTNLIDRSTMEQVFHIVWKNITPEQFRYDQLGEVSGKAPSRRNGEGQRYPNLPPEGHFLLFF